LPEFTSAAQSAISCLLARGLVIAAERTEGKVWPEVGWLPQHFLNFLPLPQGQGEFLETLVSVVFIGAYSSSFDFSWMTSWVSSPSASLT
jgi:hypothetical protein